MRAIVLSIGDELVSGVTVNTNSAWLAGELAELGIGVERHVTVGDEMGAIVAGIREAVASLGLTADAGGGNAEGGGAVSGLLLMTGGLGPTEDDRTRRGLAEAMMQELVEDPDAMVQIERYFAARGRVMSGTNRLQALRPHGATILENTAGTAPGLRARHGGVEIFVMPGVPGEMREMFLKSVKPWVGEMMRARGGAVEVRRALKINTFGMGESVLGEKIRDLMVRKEGEQKVVVGTTVHEGVVSVRIYANGTETEVEAELRGMREEIGRRLGRYIFGEGEETLERAVGELLKGEKLTVATAESCTGGMMAMMLTRTAGSSAYFLRGWVTYANVAKQEELGVAEEMIAAKGAVSEEVARAMAEGARKMAGADFGISTTGVAGPDGGSAEKPVGTVWIGISSASGTEARRFVFPGTREQVRLRASQRGLVWLRWKLMGVEEGDGTTKSSKG